MPRPKLYQVPKNPGLMRDTEKVRASTQYYSDCIGPEGKRTRRFLSSNIEVAKKKLFKLMADSAKSEEEELPEVGPYSLSEAQLGSLESRTSRGLKESTAKRYRSSDRIAQAFFEGRYIHELKKSDIEKFLTVRSKKASPTTGNRDLTRLSQVLSWAVDREWIPSNPARGVKKNREPEGRNSPLNEIQEKALMKSASPYLADMIRAALLSGMRQGEQFSARWDHVDNGRLLVPPTSSKNSKGRMIPLTEELLSILERQMSRVGESELIWPNSRGTRWHRGNFRVHQWRPAFNAAGLQDYTWHDLRHSFCSRLRQRGASLVDIAELAGHSTLSVTRRYAHHSDNHLRGVMALL